MEVPSAVLPRPRMSRTGKVLIGGLTVLIGAGGCDQRDRPQPPLAYGADFSELNLNSVQGVAIPATDRGCQAWVVCQSTCGFCRRLAASDAEQRWLLVEAPETALRFARTYALDPRSVALYYLAGEESGLQRLGLNATPTVIVTDANGIIRDVRVGSPQRDTIAALLAAMNCHAEP